MKEPERKQWVRAARKEWSRTRSVQIDENAKVILRDDGSGYVQCWIWVDGICRNPRCTNALNDNEGWDGFCGSCADKIEARIMNSESELATLYTID